MTQPNFQPIWLPDEITEDMVMAGYNAMRDPATNLPAPWIMFGTAFKVFQAMVAAAPVAPEQEQHNLFQMAVCNGLQILSPDGEPTAVVRWHPWTEQNRVSADATDCVAAGWPVDSYTMTCLAIKKALIAKGALPAEEATPAPAQPSNFD